MDAAVRKMFSVSKEDFLEDEEAKYQAGQVKKKRAKKLNA
jgi:hypothetical protein